MELYLGGRRALVTGASRGIGYATAANLAQEGCDLILVSRNFKSLEIARDRIQKNANVVVAIDALDMSDSTSANTLAQKYPDVDILINNAGAIPGGSLEQIDDARWRSAWDLKVFGYINLTREYYRLMKVRAKGVIINIIGNAGERVDAAYIAGSAANASLMAFTRALGAAAPNDGIRVVGINPGPVATERLVDIMKKQAQDQFGHSDRWNELTQKLPFARAAKPEEIAAMATFLASDLSGFTSGTIVTIDGGLASRPSS